MNDNFGIFWRRIRRRKSAAFTAAVTCARASCRSASGHVRPRANGSVGRSVLAGLSILCAMALSGCGPGPTLESRSDPISASAVSPTSSELHICRPDRALLAPQPAPDCGFGRADLKTLDPDQWTRLKLEYELKCYKEAEKIARKRLQVLQAATRCEALPAR